VADVAAVDVTTEQAQQVVPVPALVAEELDDQLDIPPFVSPPIHAETKSR
jgi:hypothetical protein